MLWQRLRAVRQMTLRTKAGWQGVGEVVVSQPSEHVLLFTEKGHWEGREISFHNVYRWTLDRGELLLEHLRQGEGRPVLLLRFTQKDEHTFTSLQPHVCGKDTYVGQLHLDAKGIHLSWSIQGPKKDQEIDIIYF